MNHFCSDEAGFDLGRESGRRRLKRDLGLGLLAGSIGSAAALSSVIGALWAIPLGALLGGGTILIAHIDNDLCPRKNSTPSDSGDS